MAYDQIDSSSGRNALKLCTLCPHEIDFLNVGACLDEINAPLIASHQFPRRMTPSQANEFMAALRSGHVEAYYQWRAIRPDNRAPKKVSRSLQPLSGMGERSFAPFQRESG